MCCYFISQRKGLRLASCYWLNTSVEESLKTCNTKLNKLSLRQHRPQTPEKRPANGGGQGAQTMQTDTGRSGRTHAPDSESSRSATSRGEQTADLHADNSPSAHGPTNRATGQSLPSSHEDAGVASKSASKNHDKCNRTDVYSTLTVAHAERSLPESYADVASARRTNCVFNTTESDQPATTQDTTQTSNSPTPPSNEKWTKKSPRRPKPNTGSKNPVDKKPLGKLLGAERPFITLEGSAQTAPLMTSCSSADHTATYSTAAFCPRKEQEHRPHDW